MMASTIPLFLSSNIRQTQPVAIVDQFEDEVANHFKVNVDSVPFARLHVAAI